MIDKRRLTRRNRARVRPASLLRLVPWVAAFNVTGCGSLNPAFLSLLDTSGTGGVVNLDNAPGHLVVAFVNNVTVDERLLSYLETAGEVSLTAEEKASLHPLIRATIRITFVDQSVLTIEAVTGNERLIESGFPRIEFEDTIPPQVFTRVVLCDVASVELLIADIQVFMPVEITAWELIQTTNDTGNVAGVTFEPRTRTPPQFRPLQIDTVDDNLNIQTLRNVDIRDVPSGVTNPSCGSVIAIVLDGTLTAPFLERDGQAISQAPSYDQNDTATIAAIGGRYRFGVSIN